MYKAECADCKTDTCDHHPNFNAFSAGLKIMVAEKKMEAIYAYIQDHEPTVEGLMSLDIGVYGAISKEEAERVIEALSKTQEV